jgi:TP901 family phage tail tape measure protein
MADVNANIGINLETSAALAQLKDLQRQLAIFNTSVLRTTDTAIRGQKKLAANLVNSINDTGKFVAQLRNVDTTVESFTKNLEKNKFSIKEYFKFAGASTKSFSGLFRSEFDTINKVAEDRVKRLQTQYIKLGKSATGVTEAISIMPKSLDMGNYSVQMQMAAQRQALFNQLVKQGSTNLINFGKNTQWAGRQLMVGFTIPLMILGSTASKTFMEMEQAAISFRKVYGDLFTPEPEREQALESIQELGRIFTKYGIAVKDTLNLAADAAAAGFAGLDLQRQTTEATRLSVLGQIDTQKALETTIALQNAFKISSEELAGSINFLNAVENQTVLSLDDITQAIPRVGPIVEQLGGNIKDLAFFLTAMKEGGVSAAQGANALKSGLASLIAPSEKSAAALMNYGININEIVERNQGNLRQTVVEFAAALDTLDPLNRSRAIEQLFGKFQFARISALFNNITRDGTQASRVLDLSSASLEELATLAESELGVVSESGTAKFKKAVEELKLALIPIGEEFLKAATPILEFISGIIEKFANLSDGTKKALTIVIAAVGGLAPVVLMSFGLLNNLIGNAIKFALTLRQGYLKLTGQSTILSQQTNFLTDAQRDSLAAAHSLNQTHAGLTQVFNVEAESLSRLITVYQNATKAAQNFANINRNTMVPGFNPNILGPNPKRYNKGVVMVPGTGNTDKVPAMLTPGEAVIPKAMAKRYAPLIEGMIAGNIPGYARGVSSVVEKNKSWIESQSSRVPESDRSSIIKQISTDLRTVSVDMIDSYKQLVENLDTLSTTILKQNSEIKGMKKTQFAHTGPGQRVPASSLVGMLPGITGGMTEKGARTESARVREFAEIFPDKQVGIKSGLGVGLRADLNNALDKGSADLVEVINDFRTKGIEKWRQTIEIGGGAFDELIPELQEFDQQVISRLNEAQQNGAQLIVDTDAQIEQARQTAIAKGKEFDQSVYVSLESIENEVLQNLDLLGDNLKQVINTAANTITEIRAELTQGEYEYGVRQGLDPAFFGQEGRKVGNITSGNAARFRRTGGLGPMPTPVGLNALNQTATNLGQSAAINVGEGAGTQSPSKFTFDDGEDIARGLEQGMINRMDDVARVANQLGQTAVTESGLIIPANAGRSGSGRPRPSIGFGGTGGIPPQTTNPGPIDDENRAREQNTKVIMTGTDKLQSMNRLMMSGSFALTSLAGAGSFAGGSLGELSNKIFKVSGLLFGLQAIIQLVTDQMVIELALKRANNAATAMGAANFKSLFTKGGGLLGFGKNLLTAGKFLIRFLGPLGLLTSAVVASYAVWRKVKSDRDEERKAIEGLGKAAKLTSEQIKTLGDFFGVVPLKLPSQLASTDLFVTGPAERTELEKLKESEEFQKQFTDIINALRTARNDETRLTLQTIGLELSATGYSQEQIALVIKALQEEAGKTDVSVDFKSFNIDNYLKDFNKSAKRFEKEIENQASRTFKKLETSYGEHGEVIHKFVDALLPPTSEYEKFEGIIATKFSSALDAITGQFRNGIIDAEEFEKRIEKLNTQLGDLPAIASRSIANNLLTLLNEESRKAVESLGSVEAQVLAVRAAFLGLDVAAELAMLSITQTDAKDRADYLSWLDAINKKIKERTSIIDKAVKPDGEKTKGTGGTKELSDFDKKIQETLSRLKNLRDASINTAGGMKELIRVIGRSGTGLDKFNGIAQQMLNMGKVGLNREFIDYVTSLDQEAQKAFFSIEKGMVKLTAAGRRLNKALNQITLGDISRSYKQQTKDLRAQIIAFNRLRASGLSTADALEMVADAQWALALATAATSGKFKKLIKDFNEYKNALADFESLDPYAAFNKEYDKAIELLDLQEEEIRLKFEPLIEFDEEILEGLQDKVSEIQDEINEKQEGIELIRRDIDINYDRPIEALQREANILSNELTLLDREATKINERYDKQAEALNKIAEINQDIIAQEKSKVSLADALTKGDISAAAQAMQEMRATQATARQNAMTSSLDRARENELNNLRSISGKTRAEIEERQFEISQQTFALEQKKLVLLDQIRVIEDEIYVIQTTRLKAAEEDVRKQEKAVKGLEKQYKEALKPIIEKRRELERVKNAVDLARLEGVKFEDQMKKIKDLVTDIKKQWDDIKDKKVKMEVHKICTEEGCDCGGSGGGGGGGGGGSNVTQQTKPKTTPTTTTTGSSTTTPTGPSRESTTDNIVDAYIDAMQYLDDSFRGIGSSGYEDNRSPAEVGKDSAAKQDAAAAKRAQEAKAAADGAAARAKNAAQIASVAKQEAAAASRGASMPVSQQAKSNAALADAYRQANLYRSMGGIIKGYAAGGMVRVPPAEPPPAQTMNMGGVVSKYMNMGGIFKPKGTDTVPAMLTPGEFVIRKYAVKDFGLDKLKAINSGTYNDGSVYNYNLNLNVKSDANADDIAQTVIAQIKRIEGQRIRGNRF